MTYADAKLTTCVQAEHQRCGAQRVPICRLDGVNDESLKRITVSLQGLSQTERLQTIEAFSQVGMTHMRGQAPMGFLEQEVSDWAADIEATLPVATK